MLGDYRVGVGLGRWARAKGMSPVAYVRCKPWAMACDEWVVRNPPMPERRVTTLAEILAERARRMAELNKEFAREDEVRRAKLSPEERAAEDRSDAANARVWSLRRAEAISFDEASQLYGLPIEKREAELAELEAAKLPVAA